MARPRQAAHVSASLGRSTAGRWWAGLALAAAATTAPLRAQDSTGHRTALRWIAGSATVAAALVFDPHVRDFARAHQTPGLDKLAGGLDPFGRAKYLVPALTADYLVPLVLRDAPWAHAALRVGLSYAASDALEAVLKPIVGRHRPAAAGGSLRFHPFASTDEWFSFPSAHCVHIFSIAAAVSDEADDRWVTAASFGVASLVAAQRVYRQAHWTSDVLTSAILGVATSRATLHWLQRHGLGRLLPPLGAGP